MLTETTLRSAVEALWNKLWSGGLANPLDAIEQLSFLLFLKRLDEREQDAERAAKLRGQRFTPIFPKPDLRWSHWTQLPADAALKHVKEAVFPFIKTLGGAGGSFATQMENAEFKINKPSLLIEACKAIDAMQISAQNQDVQGDLYESLLSKLNTAGQNGQFRTPRHIIRMMVNMCDPHPGERICDPAAGTCGFLVNAWQHLLETHTDPRDIIYDEEGYPHGLTGSKLTKEEYEFSQTKALTGFDSDSGMTMLRIGSMNLMLHGIIAPNFRYTDTLSKAFTEERVYDVVLANPPFKGAIDSPSERGLGRRDGTVKWDRRTGDSGSKGDKRDGEVGPENVRKMTDSMADGAVCCEPVSASEFPDLQGKYREILEFRARFEVCEVRNRSSHRCFSPKFPRIRNRELVLNNSEGPGDIRELNLAIRESAQETVQRPVCR